MTNFDFLNPGHPGAPADIEVRPPRYRTWGWSIEMTPWYSDLGKHSHRTKKEVEYTLACLTDDALYVRTGYKNLSDRTKAIAELNAFEPSAVLKPTYNRFPLSAVHRLRYSESLGLLELVHFDGRGEEIIDEGSKQTGLIFESLRQCLAPNVAIATEDMRGWRNLKAPLAMLGTTLVITGSLIYHAFSYEHEQPRNDRNLLVHAIDRFVEKLGPTPIVVLAVGTIVAAVAFLIYRHVHPQQIQSVTVEQ